MQATARRTGNWWAVQAEYRGQPIFTQTKRLDQVEEFVRDAFATIGVDVTNETVEVIPVVDGAAAATVARVASQEAAVAARAASESMRRAAAILRSEGLPVRDVAVMLDISPQRVSQLAMATRPDTA